MFFSMSEYSFEERKRERRREEGGGKETQIEIEKICESISRKIFNKEPS